MKIYYYSQNNQSYGPLDLNELKSKLLEKNDLVWKDGLEEWVMAKNLPELNGFYKLTPPPIPVNPSISIEDKVETKITKPASEAITVGILILVCHIILFYLFNKKIDYTTSKILGLVYLLIRILATVYAVNLSKKLNRQSGPWGLFAFLSPGIALIIIGNLKRLNYEIYPYINKNENEKIIEYEKDIVRLLEEKSYDNASEVVNHLIKNFDYKDLNQTLFSIVFYYKNEKRKMIDVIEKSDSISKNKFSIFKIIEALTNDKKLELKELSKNINEKNWLWLKYIIENPIEEYEINYLEKYNLGKEVLKISVQLKNSPNNTLSIPGKYMLLVFIEGFLFIDAESKSFFIPILSFKGMKKIDDHELSLIFYNETKICFKYILEDYRDLFTVSELMRLIKSIWTKRLPNKIIESFYIEEQRNYTNK